MHLVTQILRRAPLFYMVVTCNFGRNVSIATVDFGFTPAPCCSIFQYKAGQGKHHKQASNLGSLETSHVGHWLRLPYITPSRLNQRRHVHGPAPVNNTDVAYSHGKNVTYLFKSCLVKLSSLPSKSRASSLAQVLHISCSWMIPVLFYIKF